ncbi:PucR family transcriptional regulator [Rhodococcus jostii]|uniref:PucR family transcriptional regulator n=1 Tax=Rhodococcus jostii TaxID=132919 RepID=UPI003649988B
MAEQSGDNARSELDETALRQLIVELIEHLHRRAYEIGELIAQRYRENIVEYRSLPDGFIEQDVAPTARANLEAMLASLTDDDSAVSERDDGNTARYSPFRDSAVRRFHQGVPVQALLHAYRLWGHTVWEQVRQAPQIRNNPELGLVVAGKIMRHVDLVSTAVAQAYLEEASGVMRDREVVRRDLLEALISGNASPERIDRLSQYFGLPTTARYTVFLVRSRKLSRFSPESLRKTLETVRHHLHPTETGFLTGVRDEEVVAIYPLHRAASQQEMLREQADALAAMLPRFVVGVSRAHTGLGTVSSAYREAQDAIASTQVTDETRAQFYADAMLDHIVASSPFKSVLYEEVIEPLEQYDRDHRAELVATLRAYCASGFNLAGTAKSLIVQPNTVRYRLKRIHELTGQDPFVSNNLILLALALRAAP